MQFDESFNHQNSNVLILCRIPLSEINKSQLLLSFMSHLNVFRDCFYQKPYDKFEIITFSITGNVDLNESKYKSSDRLKSKAYLHGLLGI